MEKFEMHCHTRENDIVVTLDAPEIVEMYHSIGYNGMVITNHFFDLSLEWYKDVLEGASHRQIIDYYLRGYRAAKQKGDELSMNILMGIELRFDGTINDYLVYGIDEDFLYDSPLLNTLTLDSFLEILPEDAIVYQAHPFRNNMTVTDPKKLYGVEVYNGGTNDERNRFADIWADEYSLRKISGSDYHRPEHLGKGGVIFENSIGDIHSLVDELKAGRYTLIKNGK